MVSKKIKELLKSEEGELESKETKVISLEKKFNKLHHHLLKEIIDFCNENDLYPDEIHFYADHLLDSIKFKDWHPGTDSCLGLLDKNGEIIIESL